MALQRLKLRRELQMKICIVKMRIFLYTYF